MNSVNTVPDIQSFYATAPGIARQRNGSETSIFFEPVSTWTPPTASSRITPAIVSHDGRQETPTIVACTASHPVPCNENMQREHEHSSTEKDMDTEDRTEDNEREEGDKVNCWWCRITVVSKNQACFVPSSYDEYRGRYVTCGYFCSWECAKAFNFDLNDRKRPYRSYLLHSLFKRLYGLSRSREIKNARHWSEMRRYGGSMSDTEYQKGKRTTLETTGFSRTDASRSGGIWNKKKTDCQENVNNH